MSKRVHVLDYGVSNLNSICRALRYLGAEVELVGSAAGVGKADRLVLPGVGAFGAGMDNLETLTLIEPVRAFAATSKPLIGICLGMQMLFDGSCEFGSHRGLGLVPGNIVPIPPQGPSGEAHRIPHIGWNSLLFADPPPPLLAGLPGEPAVYFVHSFMAQAADPASVIARVDYNGVAVPAIIQRDNVSGCQFHPEKSGPVGLKILKNFLDL